MFYYYGPEIVYWMTRARFANVRNVAFENVDSWTVSALVMCKLNYAAELENTTHQTADQMDLMDLSYPPLPHTDDIPKNADLADGFPDSIDPKDQAVYQPANVTYNDGTKNGTNGGPDLSMWVQMPSVTLDPRDYKEYAVPTTHPVYPTPRCIGRIPEFPNHPSVNRDYAQNQITKYCKAVGTGNGSPDGGLILDSKAPYAPIGYPVKDNQPNSDDSTLWLSTSLVQAANCEKGFMMDQTDCNALFGRILDGCDTDSADKFGGTAVRGCGIYNMQTSIGMGQTPPRGEIQGMVDLWASRGNTTFF